MIIFNTVHPKIYGLKCTDSENIFVFDDKNFWPPVQGSENFVNFDINLKSQYFHNFCNRLA